MLHLTSMALLRVPHKPRSASRESLATAPSSDDWRFSRPPGATNARRSHGLRGSSILRAAPVDLPWRGPSTSSLPFAAQPLANASSVKQNRPIFSGITQDTSHGVGPSANLNVTYRAWRTTLAPALITLPRNVLGVQCSMLASTTTLATKLAKLHASANNCDRLGCEHSHGNAIASNSRRACFASFTDQPYRACCRTAPFTWRTSSSSSLRS